MYRKIAGICIYIFDFPILRNHILIYLTKFYTAYINACVTISFSDFLTRLIKRSCVPTQAPGRNEMRGQNVLRMQFVRCLIWNRRFSCRLPSSSVILSHIYNTAISIGGIGRGPGQPDPMQLVMLPIGFVQIQ